MDISVAGQALEFLGALALGAALGVVYDFMRIMRTKIRGKIFTAVSDILFWGVSAAAAFWFAMSFGGGELRLFAAAGMVLGAVSYFRFLSPGVRAVGYFLADGLAALLGILALPLSAGLYQARKFVCFAKKILAFHLKIGKIRVTPQTMRRMDALLVNAGRDGQYREKEKEVGSVYKGGGAGLYSLRGGVPDRFTGQDQPRKRKSGSSSRADRRPDGSGRQIPGGYRL
jgi:hypothetical protein